MQAAWRAFARMGEHDMALSDLERALERDPKLAEAYRERGVVRTALGDYDAALVDFEQVFSCDLLTPSATSSAAFA